MTTQFQTGQKVASCEVVRRLGAGAMGVVYLGRHPEHGEVCLKVIKGEFQPEGLMMRRFIREAEAAQRVQHSNVVRCFGLERDKDVTVLVQEFVDGGDLRQYVREQGGKLSTGEALRVVREISLGLGAAHAAGLVHRDLKPENVLMTRQGQAKLGDLGLVLQVDGEPLDGKTILTQKGQALGTPLYMAPEQWAEAHEVDHRADLYALGVLLHQLVSGKAPFAGKNLTTLMRAHMVKPPKPLREHLPNAPQGVETIILRLLEKEPDDRPESAAQVVMAIERVADGLNLGAEVRGRLRRSTRRQPSERARVVAADLGTNPLAATQISHPIAPAQDSRPGSQVDSVAPQSPSAAGGGDMLGQVIAGKFEIQKELGKGGMGVVYKARHTLLGDDYAIKVLLPRFAQDGEFRSRFLREARLLQRFTHEGAVTLRDFGEHQGSLYMALDFAPGKTLSEVLKDEGPFSQDRALSLARQILPCLAKAHQAGLVHRDLKPANLLVESLSSGGDRVRVLDFGIAKVVDEAQASTETDGQLTGTGITLGTPYYMSPEQDAGDAVDGRSDLYSFACVLYELLSGQRPLAAQTVRQLRYKIQFELPEDLASRATTALSPGFAAAVMSGLAKDPKDRPADADAFLAALEAGATGALQPPTATPPARNAAGAPQTRLDDSRFHEDPTLALSGDEATMAIAANRKGGWLAPVLGVAILGLLGAIGAVLLTRKGPVRIASFNAPKASQAPTATLEGQLNRPGRARAGGVEVETDAEGRFTLEVPLEPGDNTLQLEVIGDDGSRDSKALSIAHDATPPKLAVTGLRGGRIILAGAAVLRGQSSDGSGAVTLTASWDGGAAAPVSLTQGAFELPVPEGASRVTLVAQDSFGNRQTLEAAITRGLEIELSEAPLVTREAEVRIQGRASYGPVTVTLAGAELKTGSDGRFEGTIALSEGLNRILVRATDGEQQAEAQLELRRDSADPRLTLRGWSGDGVALIDRRGGATGRVVDDSEVTVSLSGEVLDLDEAGNFAISGESRSDGESGELIVRDAAGNRTVVALEFTSRVIFVEPPELPRATTATNLVIAGMVSQPNAEVTVGTQACKADAEGRFSVEVALQEGKNLIALRAGPAGGGGEERAPQVVICDRTDPKIEVEGLASAGAEVYAGAEGALIGRVVDANPQSIIVAGQALPLDPEGRFRFAPKGWLGPREVELEARDVADQVTKRKVILVPPLRILRVEGERGCVQEASLALRLELSYGPASVSVLDRGGAEVATGLLESKEGDLTLPLAEGPNQLKLVARARDGSEDTRSLSVVRDSEKPKLFFDGRDGAGEVRVGADYEVSGRVEDATAVTLTFQGRPVELGGGGRFKVVVERFKAPATILLKAVDAAGNSKEAEVLVVTPEAREARERIGVILRDREAWREADPAVQTLAAKTVASRLGGDFELRNLNEYSCGGVSHRIATFVHTPTGIELQLIPGGTFTMGSDAADAEERPAHTVRIRQPFLMARFELSQRQWDAIGGSDKRNARDPDRPIEKVSWKDILAWLTKAGGGLRLPSEAEWEYACRAGTSSQFFWGDAYDASYCWALDRQTHDVRAHAGRPNAFGISDMLGNVAEWVADDWHDDYTTGPNDARPVTSTGAPGFGVVRGGGYSDKEDYVRSAERLKLYRDYPKGDLGFRVAVSIPLD